MLRKPGWRSRAVAEALTTLTRLAVVREIEEDEGGATLRFLHGGQGRLSIGDANYATHLRLARRSQERQHPVGVSLGDGQAVTEVLRADNDVPTGILDEAHRGLVFFQGHDGIFLIKSDLPQAARIRAVLEEAIRHEASVWFISQKADLTLLDVLPVG
jgi:hypothetical protein